MDVITAQVVDGAIAANEEPGRMVVHPGDEILRSVGSISGMGRSV